MLARIEYLFFALFVVLVFTADARSQGGVAPDRVVVSYPSKSITSFPILETAQRRGFFRKENLDVSPVYMRGGIDIKAVLTGDADFGTGATTAVTAFVAGFQSTRGSSITPSGIVCNTIRSITSRISRCRWSASGWSFSA